MSERAELLESIAATIEDYREGEIDRPTPEHVEEWVGQFDRSVRLPMLREMDHVLARTYINGTRMANFIQGLVRDEALVGTKPKRFWRATRFLELQTSGTSQQHSLSLMDEALKAELGLGVDECGESPARYVYLDDGIFTGNRIKNDLVAWLEGLPRGETVELHVIAYVLHTGGQYYANRAVEAAAAGQRLSLKPNWWRVLEFEDQLAHINRSDVLQPRALPDDDDVHEYVEGMSYKPQLRTADGVGPQKLFSSEAGRALLEQEFLKAGVRIRKQSPYLNDYQRPLGNMVLETLGFGTMFVTYRNCPNNAPLALWAGDPWYPLFPRRTNVPAAADFDFDL